MAALPPGSARRRPRRGTLERPVSGRLYRGTWLLVGIPLLAAAFSIHKPNPLPSPQPALPASFVAGVSIPVVPIVVLVLVAAFAGVTAAVLPARRAGRLDVLEAIAV